MSFEQDIEDVWRNKIFYYYNKINGEINARLKTFLKPPTIDISRENKNLWGQWSSEKNTLSITLNLLRNFQWEAVEYVLRHEMAHQIVHEIFKIHDARAHGEVFKKACDVVNIDPRACASADFLAKFQGSGSSGISDKIRALLNKGYDKAVTEEEAKLFLEKAQELMLRHNVTLKDLYGENRVFVARPVGYNYNRYPVWLNCLLSIMRDHYGVLTIINCSYGGGCKRIELFGEPHNLDVAEYVFHAILNNAQVLYDKFLENHQNRLKNDPAYRASFERRSWTAKKGEYTTVRKISERAFMEGLLSGFKIRLQDSRTSVLKEMEKENNYNGKLVHIADKVLKEKFSRFYGRTRVVHSVGARGVGFSQGMSNAKNLSIHSGVKSGVGKRLQLSA